MITTISNEWLSVSINSLGAAMTSIAGANGDEYLWDGNPDVWNGQAPNLFPFVGKVNNGTYTFEGESYNISKHGFARTSEFEIVAQSESSVTYRLSQSDSTLAAYPFNFDFDITYVFDENALRVVYDVMNNSQTVMPFSVGAHPAFACNWTDGDSITDYYLQFDEKETCPYIQFNGVALSHEEHEALFESDTLEVTNSMFDVDALIFRGLKSNAVTLRSKLSEKSVRVEYPGFTYLGIWSKPKAPYLCIEPWYGVDDFVNSNGDLMKKEGVEIIDPNQAFNCEYKIIIG